MSEHTGTIVIEGDQISLSDPTVGKLTSPTGEIKCSCGWNARSSGTEKNCIPTLKGAFAAHQHQQQSVPLHRK